LEVDLAEEKHLLKDLRLRLRHRELRPVYEVGMAQRRQPQQAGWREDMDTVSGKENLGQAVMMRLLTPRGELTALGHPSYGSRLHELIGDLNNEVRRNLTKLYILEALAMEPRIDQVVSIAVKPMPGTRDCVDVQLVVKPIGFEETVAIGPFTLEFAP